MTSPLQRRRSTSVISCSFARRCDTWAVAAASRPWIVSVIPVASNSVAAAPPAIAVAHRRFTSPSRGIDDIAGTHASHAPLAPLPPLELDLCFEALYVPENRRERDALAVTKKRNRAVSRLRIAV